ncbi:MT-A70 family methyltransferase [Roseovarius pacificus]|uniref:MT-A70 family methyltransferase n=1 Tax=Roseovarius pacificus TaxID=337701 RepID=UPI002A18ADFF|nr:MT-A70 family methyltransferase [Roseovarius pacificus]
MLYGDFNEIPLFRYGMIMADPPWSFDNWSAAGEGKNAKAHYDCTGLDWIKSLRVGDLATPDCVLWLWATNPMLPQALSVMEAWGFTFKTAGHWSKKTASGKQAFGTGYILRCAGEPFLIGTIGSPKTSRSVRSVIEGPLREHSRKPDEAFLAAEQLCGDVARLELFSRQERAGWDCFGNEATKWGSASSPIESKGTIGHG